MASELTLSTSTVEMCRALSKELSTAEFLGNAFKRKPADILAALLTGAELGIGPMAALRNISFRDGKASLTADLMIGLVLQHPSCEYLRPVSSDEKHATWVGKRKGQPERKLTWTLERAEKAGLLKQRYNDKKEPYDHGWKKYPEDNLNARCGVGLCRLLWRDVTLGLASRNEIEDGDFSEREVQGEHVVSQVEVRCPPEPVVAAIDDHSPEILVSGELISATPIEAKKRKLVVKEEARPAAPVAAVVEEVQKPRLREPGDDDGDESPLDNDNAAEPFENEDPELDEYVLKLRHCSTVGEREDIVMQLKRLKLEGYVAPEAIRAARLKEYKKAVERQGDSG